MKTEQVQEQPITEETINEDIETTMWDMVVDQVSEWSVNDLDKYLDEISQESQEIKQQAIDKMQKYIDDLKGWVESEYSEIILKIDEEEQIEE